MRLLCRAVFLATLASGALVLSAGCGHVATDPLGLIEGALSQQYFDAHHAFPSDQEDDLLARQAKAMLARVYGMPSPPPAAASPQVDTQAVKNAHGGDAVDEALLAVYILHFGALPDDYTQSQIALLAGTSGGAPLPIVAARK